MSIVARGMGGGRSERAQKNAHAEHGRRDAENERAEGERSDCDFDAEPRRAQRKRGGRQCGLGVVADWWGSSAEVGEGAESNGVRRGCARAHCGGLRWGARIEACLGGGERGGRRNGRRRTIPRTVEPASTIITIVIAVIVLLVVIALVRWYSG